MIAIASDDRPHADWNADVARRLGTPQPQRTGSLRRIDQVLGELLAGYNLPSECQQPAPQLQAEMAA